MPKYSQSFYAGQKEGSLRSAGHILPIVLDNISVGSVVDVGCGTGSWLSVCRELGLMDVFGYEGEWAKAARLDPSIEILAADIEKPLPINRRFDLAICMEVAEHLSEARAPGLIADLAGLADCVLFSAAVPGQGGTNHINEQWQSYWVTFFRSHGYIPYDIIRPSIWRNTDVEWWYRQNTILYVKGFESFRISAEPAKVIDLACVEYVESLGIRTQSLRHVVKTFMPAARNAFLKRVLSH